MRLTSLSFGDNEAIPPCHARARIASEDFRPCVIPAENYNPQFSWDDVPPETQSFALICRDTQALSKSKLHEGKLHEGTLQDYYQAGQQIPAHVPRVDFFHWVLIDLPPHKREISEGEFSEQESKKGPHTLYGARHGLNDYTHWFAADENLRGDYFGYEGLYPAWNDLAVHHYVFTLYALNVSRLSVEDRFMGEEALAAMQGTILAMASLVGTYTLNDVLAPTMIGSPTAA